MCELQEVREKARTNKRKLELDIHLVVVLCILSKETFAITKVKMDTDVPKRRKVCVPLAFPVFVYNRGDIRVFPS
jgi:hypothetical protein